MNTTVMQTKRMDRAKGNGSREQLTTLICRAPGRGNPDRYLCGAKLGEAALLVRYMGSVRRWNDRLPSCEEPRDVRRCPRCGWFNLFEPL
ncbi:MAG: hypothetical protein P8Y10_04625 [Gemmatimonadales bacterium]